MRFLGVELPEKNILDKVARTAYEVSLDEYRRDPELLLHKKLPLSEQEIETRQTRKKFWLELAAETPEKIFQTFKNSSLQKAKDEYGRLYVFEVLSTAVKANPELAFTSLSSYQNWKDENNNSIVKPLLQIAIKENPELAFRYLDRYQHLVEGNEKIAKSLLNYAAQQYKDPLLFEELFHEVQWRKNQKNLILVFLESASSVDSQKFWGLNDRMPLTDKVSDDWISFTQLHANGMSSDMGHIATLLGVEPVIFDYATGTRYQNYKGYATPLAQFFDQLGYTTTFLSTASLEFLDQESFLKYAGYQHLVGPEAFKWKKRYAFDAAPDEDLYEKAIELVKNQTSPFFLTLQTISSHTPYDTPYGRSAEAMYRYEDQTFSDFYHELKKTDFFDNGLLIVIGDHRKMTPLEDAEFEKWGTTAAAKIIGFMIGKGIDTDQIDDHLYQQTDLFYSLLAEFWTGKVNVFEKYNDLFTQKILRHWTIKHWYDQKKSNIADAEGNYGYIDIDRMKIAQASASFPKDEILNYLKLSIAYQQQKQKEKSGFLSWENDDMVYLISHRGETQAATENSLDAFKAAYELWADGLEFDATTTKDGKMVVYHGPKISHLTTCKTETKDMCQLTRDELQKCKLNDGQNILLLEEMLPKIKNRFSYLFLEYKVPENPVCSQNVQSHLEEIISLVKKNKLDGKVVFSSYNKEVTSLLSKRGDLSTALDTYSLADVDKLSWNYFSYFMMPAESFSEPLIEKIKKIWVDGVAYVVNDPSFAQKLKKMGIRFFMTDELEKMKKSLEN